MDVSQHSERRVEGPLGGARRILLFDPHPQSRTTTSLVLSKRGYVCEPVDSTASAIAAMDAFRPDVVIYEWDLRGGSALGFAKELRARAEGYGCSLIVIAVSAADEPAGFSQREDIDAYFTKPVYVGELERAFG